MKRRFSEQSEWPKQNCSLQEENRQDKNDFCSSAKSAKPNSYTEVLRYRFYFFKPSKSVAGLPVFQHSNKQAIYGQKKLYFELRSYFYNESVMEK
jgi:hypothetical protein